MNPYLEIDNDALVEECVKGNPDALTLFYTRFAPKMYGVVMRYVNNPKDAEDILHDGFIVAFTRLNTLRHPERVEYWLASIMKNLSLQFLQAQDVVGILHELPEVEDSPEFDDIIDLPTIEALIHKLPKGYQTVFRLSVLENKTHKEIADILGIAPNSSSSQLFHAKLMMRRLITEHRAKAGLLSLLLILLSLGILWWRNPASEAVFDRQLVARATLTSPARSYAGEPLLSADVTPALRTAHRSMVIPDETASEPLLEAADTAVTKAANPLVSRADTVAEAPETPTARPSLFDHDLIADNRPITPIKTKRNNGLTVKIGGSPSISVRTGGYDLAAPGLAEDPILGTDNTIIPLPSVTTSTPPVDFSDCSHTKRMPITVGVAVNKSFSRLFGIETGLTYTYLQSTLNNRGYFSDCRWHYLGIPLKATVNTYTTSRFSFYGAAGMQLDIPLLSNGSTNAPVNITSLPRGRFHSSPVWSVSASYGASIHLSRHMGMFIEPTVNYHFDHSFRVPNTWTDNHLGISLLVGIQINL